MGGRFVSERATQAEAVAQPLDDGRRACPGAGRRRHRLHGRARRAAGVGPSRSRARGGHLAVRRRPPARRAPSRRGCSSRAERARPRPPSTASRPRSSRCHTVRRPTSSRSCAHARSRSSTSRPTSGSATSATYERWYGAHDAPGLLGRGRLRAHRARARANRRRRTGREPRLLSDGGAPGAGAAGPGGPLRRHRDRREVRLHRAPVVGPSTWTRSQTTSGPTGSTGHRHAPEIAQELELMGALGPTSFVPHLLPIEQGPPRQLLRDPVARGDATRSSGSSTRTATAESRSSSSSARRRASATSARRTGPESTSRSMSSQERSSPSARSTTSGRAHPARRSRT